ncbi:hypothetical protein TNCT_524271 [Trichonephila clavata]|uniref:Uncharacterized protein n=1 Tax=Trichonephila clavata TaxID=2740835 RepID=A0A8X6I5C5_TRICU|nr:hypothetical protein TNCT_524271 [Trichonephila clavata]
MWGGGLHVFVMCDSPHGHAKNKNKEPDESGQEGKKECPLANSSRGPLVILQTSVVRLRDNPEEVCLPGSEASLPITPMASVGFAAVRLPNENRNLVHAGGIINWRDETSPDANPSVNLIDPIPVSSFTIPDDPVPAFPMTLPDNPVPAFPMTLPDDPVPAFRLTLPDNPEPEVGDHGDPSPITEL